MPVIPRHAESPGLHSSHRNVTSLSPDCKCESGCLQSILVEIISGTQYEMDEHCFKVESTVKNSWKEFCWPACWLKHSCTCSEMGWDVDGTVLGPQGAQYLTCTVIKKMIWKQLICKRDCRTHTVWPVWVILHCILFNSSPQKQTVNWDWVVVVYKENMELKINKIHWCWHCFPSFQCLVFIVTCDHLTRWVFVMLVNVPFKTLFPFCHAATQKTKRFM